MEKLLYIDGTLRESDSRTKLLADAFVNALADRFSVEKVVISKLGFTPKKFVDVDYFNPALPGEKEIAEAKRLATADVIVLAAPFYDMGLPSFVHAYFERISIDGYTFKSVLGSYQGLCRARKFIYITTRGALIEDNSPSDGASLYLNALSHLWGFQNLQVISASGLDVLPENIAMERLLGAISRAKRLAKRI